MPTSRSTDDEAGDSSQSQRKPNAADVRKQRKRDTDRIAQREHRKRQKQYVQDLEAELAFLKQRPSHSQVSQLCEENKQLREEVHSYRDTFSRIQSLLGDHIVTRPNTTRTISSPAKASPAEASPRSPSDDGAYQDTIPPDTGDDAANSAAESGATAGTDFGILDQTHQDSDMQPPVSSKDHSGALHMGHLTDETYSGQAGGGAQSIFDLIRTGGGVDVDNTLWLDDFRSPSNVPGLLDVDGQFQHQNMPPQPHPQPQPRLLWRYDVRHGPSSPGRSTQDASWLLNLAPPSPSYFRPSPLDPTSPPHATSPRLTSPNTPLHRLTSCISTTPQPNDNGIYGIIDKVRKHSLSHPLSREKPTLADFLLDNSSNVLSASLKEYLQAFRGVEKPAEFLGCYWTIYTLIVWHVYQTRDAFERIPRWLRPTQLQMRIPHPVGVDFIAWPALRDELVKLAQVDRDRVCEVMRLMFENMEVRVEPSLIHDLSNNGRVDDLISDLRNWSLKEEFFDSFPEFRGLCLVF